MDSWFGDHRGTIDQSALLALAFALDQEFFTVSQTSIDLDEIGRVHAGEHAVSMVDDFDHVAFTAHDYDGMCQRLAKLGISFREQRVAATSIRQLFFQDPNNVSIELNFP